MPRAWQVLTELLLLLPTPSFVEAPVATSHPPLVLASPSVFVAVARARFLARGSVRMYMRASFVRASVRACIPPSLRLFLSHPFFHTPPAPATRLLLQPHASCSSHTSPAPATRLLLQQHVIVSCSSQPAACVRASIVHSCVRVCVRACVPPFPPLCLHLHLSLSLSLALAFSLAVAYACTCVHRLCVLACERASLRPSVSSYPTPCSTCLHVRGRS
jgi:hypothetical protein